MHICNIFGHIQGSHVLINVEEIDGWVVDSGRDNDAAVA